ncbi:hypothetical protein GALL_355320 [mine drainage metagenome]|uniref:Lipopolysaccharide assembly protein A domain-containing protein n=1 Tax=mine drainage metagenome TaxID=410659 RepID=A0A1J5QS19_9ZZZZ
MTSDASSPQGTEPAAVPPSSRRPPTGKPPVPEPAGREPDVGSHADAALATTRAAAAWLATAAALVVLALLIVLILQNQETVEVHYLGLAGSLPLGTALLIAAVAGGVIVMIVGVVRLTQLRVNARRARRREAGVATRRAVPHPGPDSRTTGGSGTTR